MPIVSKAPTAPADPAPIIPRIESVKAQSNVVDTTNTFVGNLAAFASGYVYVVNYYSQILGADQATFGLDANKNKVQQQYRKINRQEIRLTGPLMPTQDPTTKQMMVEGEGLVIGRIVANAGDLFVADAGDGREAVFQVNTSEKTSIFKEAIYQIRFKMLFFSYASPSRRNDLEEKVTDVAHFIRDYARFGRDPIVGDGTYHALRSLQSIRNSLMRDYTAWFYSRDRNTILVPGQTSRTTDPFLTSAFIKTVPVSEFPEVQNIRELNLDDENLSAEPTIWQALFERRSSVLQRCRKKMGTYSTGGFTINAIFQSARYSGIDVIIYPKPERYSIDREYNNLNREPVEAALTKKPGFKGTFTEMSQESKPVLSNLDMVGIKPACADGYYVFSEAFYSDDASQPLSLLEKLTKDYFQGETLNAEQLLWLCESAHLWGELERYYYIPVLCILIRSLIQEAI